ncbi:MAG: Tn3 family transposase [Acidimicrobiales bacterium]
MWQVNDRADYGPLDVAAQGRADLDRIRKNWPDILWVLGSVHAGAVRTYDVVRVLQRDGHPTPLGGRSLPMGGSSNLCTCRPSSTTRDNGTYRRDIKGTRDLQEGRHALGRTVPPPRDARWRPGAPGPENAGRPGRRLMERPAQPFLSATFRPNIARGLYSSAAVEALDKVRALVCKG